MVCGSAPRWRLVGDRRAARDLEGDRDGEALRDDEALRDEEGRAFVRAPRRAPACPPVFASCCSRALSASAARLASAEMYRSGTEVEYLEMVAAELALIAQVIPGGSTSSVPSSFKSPLAAILKRFARRRRLRARR